jgi:hypothetical protein
MSEKVTRKKDQESTVVIRTEDIIKESSIHTNVSQQVIVTTYDKVKLCLIEHQNELNAKNGWIAPIGVFIALLTALVTANFREFLNLPPDTWQALFLLGLALSVVWTIKALYGIYKFHNRGGIEYIIEKLKRPD